VKDEDLATIKGYLDKTGPLIADIEKVRSSQVLVFICDTSIDISCAYRINKIVRKLKTEEKLDLLMESAGGDIDAASKVVKILRENSKKLATIVPFYAKSAASLLAISSDELIMCKGADLGPIDPQVKDPISGAWVPAHSIKEALAFIEGVRDPLVKLSLSDRLPPLLIGAYRDAQNAGKQYIREAIEASLPEGDKREAAISTFTERFLSHGYPIDRRLCKQVLPNVTFPDADLEDKICELHEIYEDLMIHIARTNRRPKRPPLTEDEEIAMEMEEGLLLVQADDTKCVVVNGEDITEQLHEIKL